MIESIKSIPDKYDKNTMVWKESPNCSGPKISDKPCHLRIDEMELISYTPLECLKKGDRSKCGEL